MYHQAGVKTLLCSVAGSFAGPADHRVCYFLPKLHSIVHTSAWCCRTSERDAIPGDKGYDAAIFKLPGCHVLLKVWQPKLLLGIIGGGF